MTRKAPKTEPEDHDQVVSYPGQMAKAPDRAPAHEMVAALYAIAGGVEAAEKADPDLAGEAMETQALADAAALVADLRKRLQDVELSFAGTIGRREGKIVGTLSDGRQFKLERGSDRKEWDHEDWKRDVRRTVIASLPKGLLILDEDTGETQPLGPTLQVVLAQAQEVHGSTAPRSTSLKALGLWVTDYCTSTPAPWRFSAIAPKTTTDTEK